MSPVMSKGTSWSVQTGKHRSACAVMQSESGSSPFAYTFCDLVESKVKKSKD